jgi:2-dehydropantoate 2-reductase
VVKIAVVGAGGLGGFFGGLLARSGEDVHFIARGEHLKAIQRDGLTVKSALAGDFVVKANATDDPSQIGPVDVVLFCVKTYDNSTAIPQLASLVGPETMILSLQNGISNELEIAEAVGDEHVLGALALVVAAIDAPGVVAQTAAGGIIKFGEFGGGTSERAERLLGVFKSAGINAELDTDIWVALWDKYIGICAFAGLTSLTRLPIGPVIDDPETRALFRGVLDEVASLGRARGVSVPDDIVDSWMDDMVKLAPRQPWASSSMHHDLSNGRRLELETLNGTASRLGRELDIPTPINDVIYGALRPYLNGAPEVPRAPS